MIKHTKLVLAAVALAVGIAAAPAQAGPISGTVTVANGLDAASLPANGTSIVGGLLGFPPQITNPNGSTSGGLLDFALSNGFGNALVGTYLWASPGAAVEISIPGFNFNITSATFSSVGALVCGATSCSDALTYNVVGVVTRLGGIDPTIFTGSIALTGSCIGTLSGCTGSYGGGYTYSLAATGQPTVPEPATLALLGIGLAGLGLARRRKQS